MVFQDPMTSLDPTMRVERQIMESLNRHLGMSGRQAAERAIELLELVSIPNAEERLKQYPHQFSGGMRQRVVIGIALACDPKVLIADEPTTASGLGGQQG
jgi:oligopeptide transport system ATP-binding protein